MKGMKKILVGVLSLACVFTTAVGLTACEDGADGKSAYQIWLDNGHSGTEADFLEWLKGDGGVQQEEGTDGLAYYPLPDGTYAVSQGNTIYLEEIVIPSTYKGKAVTMVVENAFENSRAKSITIPDSVTSIGVEAFSMCSSLTSITVDKGNTNYKDIDGNLYSKDGTMFIQYAIGKTATSFTILDGVTSIGDYAFFLCGSLASIVIPNSVTSIGDGAFSFCRSLTSITVDKGNTNYKDIDGNLYSKDGTMLIQYAIGKTATSFTVPDSVTSIGNNAFEYCSSLTSVVIPDSVASIGEDAFSYCGVLTSVYYKGSASEWNEIDIGSDNWYLSRVYYYSESEPTEEGYYWHYDENGEVAVW